MIEIYEITGNLPGTATKVNNINFKNSSAVASKYWQYPLRRMETNRKLDEHLIRYSYNKYVFFKVSSTGKMKNFKMNVSIDSDDDWPFGVQENQGNLATKSELYYKMTNTYQIPTSELDGSLTWVKDREIELYPMFSTTGYANATSHIITLEANTVYYSNLFVFQTAVYHSSVSDVGNGPSCKFELSFDNW